MEKLVCRVVRLFADFKLPRFGGWRHAMPSLPRFGGWSPAVLALPRFGGW